MKLFRNAVSFLIIYALCALPCSASAEILGKHISTGRLPIAQGTTLVTNIFHDGTVGRQAEHYVEYLPNPDVIPALSNGWSAYGKRTLTEANKIMNQLGYNPAMGMNADFFSFQTGVPMSNAIIDGRVFSKDSSWLWGVGFRDDGTAFTAKFPIATTVSTEDGSFFTVECINKYRQPYALYLYTEDFGDSTHSPDWGRDVVLGNISGDITLGKSITATVEEIADHDGSVPIPEGKMIISVSAEAAQDIKDRLNCLTVGQTITITTNAADSADMWNDAVYALGCTGGKLLTDGRLDVEDESPAPRTALGIKPDGSVIFYTIDGRQSGHSYGVRKETLARRLLELGCTEAVNLDGGGSTSMGAVIPGTTDFKIINSPSEGRLRSCANFLFLLKMVEPTGIPYGLILNNYGSLILSGASADVSVISAYDTSYSPASIPNNIEYYIENDAGTPASDGVSSSITQDGRVTAYGNGDVFIGAKSGDAEGSTMVTSVATPHNISIFNADGGYEITELVMEPNSVVNLSAESYWYGEKLISDNSCYKFTVVSDNASVGGIDENGVFRASGTSGATGILAVSAGICAVEIPVLILEGGTEPGFTDYPIIEGGIEKGILSTLVLYDGITEDNITVTIDAKETGFKFDTARHRLLCEVPDDGAYHRIGVFVSADDGVSAMRFFDSGRIDAIENKFSDTRGHWAEKYIAYMADCGVVNGSLEDGGAIRFNPSKNMTRTEFAIMLCNYLNVNPADYADVELPFIDKADIPWWAENQVKAIYSLGIMQGQLGEFGVSFNPAANINRMEFAISLSRLLPRGLKADKVDAADCADIPFWAEESMRTIFTQKVMSGYPDGTLMPLQSVTRAEAVKMIFNIFGA